MSEGVKPFEDIDYCDFASISSIRSIKAVFTLISGGTVYRYMPVLRRLISSLPDVGDAMFFMRARNIEQGITGLFPEIMPVGEGHPGLSLLFGRRPDRVRVLLPYRLASGSVDDPLSAAHNFLTFFESRLGGNWVWARPTEGWVTFRNDLDRGPMPSLEQFIEKNSVGVDERYSPGIAEVFYENPCETQPTPLGEVWKEIVGVPSLPVNPEARRRLLQSAYESLKEYLNDRAT
jgi:hypothetical protein